LPFDRIPHVFAPPAAMAIQSDQSVPVAAVPTCTGTLLLAAAPFPNLPKFPFPQHHAVPSDFMPQPCWTPLLMAARSYACGVTGAPQSTAVPQHSLMQLQSQVVTPQVGVLRQTDTSR
jgi:hypothetical protein